MTKTQFRAAIEQLGLTQGQAAKLLHCTIRSINAYANGQPIPFLVGEVLRLWLKTGLPRAN